MTGNPFDPSREGSLAWAGRNSDGSVTVIAQITFAFDDEIGLRAGNLIDPDVGDVTPDWGTEAAVLSHVTDVIRTAAWKGRGLTPVQAQIRSGSTSAMVPSEQFSSH